jgi:hypothetical protein
MENLEAFCRNRQIRSSKLTDSEYLADERSRTLGKLCIGMAGCINEAVRTMQVNFIFGEAMKQKPFAVDHE